MTPQEIVKGARAWLNSPERWTQQHYYDRRVEANSKASTYFTTEPLRACLVGAIIWAGKGRAQSAYENDDDIKAATELVAAKQLPDYAFGLEAATRLVSFNDDPRTTYETVIKVLDQTIEGLDA